MQKTTLVLLGVLAGLALETLPGSAAALRPWSTYRTIMWIGGSVDKKPQQVPLFFRRLRQMGVNTGMVYDGRDPAFAVTNGFPYYVENIINRGLCLKWNSRVRNWDAFVTRWAKTGRGEQAFLREYGLEDSGWRGWADAEMERVVRKNRAQQPLAYNIRDELSVTISANPFDYDFSPKSLAAFRVWLKKAYPDLASLNHEWGTRFDSWESVRPFTTDQIKRRMATGEAMPRGQPDWRAVQRVRFDPAAARSRPLRWDLAPWCDFRSFMDCSLADVLDELRQRAHRLDPQTPVGIEGTQMPDAFGGYNLWRLSQVLDWVEPYDIGNAREIFGSFMVGKPILTTVFEKESRPARRRLWHLLLEGDRGCIIWWSEDCLDWKSPNYDLTPKAKALAPVLREMTSPLARLFLRADRVWDPIAIHYSQASIQVDWLLESTVDGATWYRRFSSYEASHNRMVRVRDAWLKVFQDLGYSPRFVSREDIERNVLEKKHYRALVLPDSLALSDREVAEMRRFLKDDKPGSDRRLFADGQPGSFDSHGKLRQTAPFGNQIPDGPSAAQSVVLASHFKPSVRTGDIASYHRERLAKKPKLDWARWIQSHLGRMRPEVQVPLSTRVRVHRFRLGNARLLGFERNIAYQMSENLRQAGGNQGLEVPIKVAARLAHPGYVYDLREERFVGRTSRFTFELDPWRPSLFAVLSERVAAKGLVENLLLH